MWDISIPDLYIDTIAAKGRKPLNPLPLLFAAKERL
jgi:hypothetical protein